MEITYTNVWLHEPVSAFTCIGFVLLLISLFLVRGEKTESEKKLSVKWLIAIVVTTVGNGLLAIIQ